jgi:hypothetical protein
MKTYIISEKTIPQTPTEEDKNVCEGQITNAECINAIKSFKNNKSPGIDGLASEFYKIFWPEIGKLLVNVFNLSFGNGYLGNSMNQAHITIIEKSGKDNKLLKNWFTKYLLRTKKKRGYIHKCATEVSLKAYSSA